LSKSSANIKRMFGCLPWVVGNNSSRSTATATAGSISFAFDSFPLAAGRKGGKGRRGRKKRGRRREESLSFSREREEKKTVPA
jgi:hypothetical protein